MVTIAKMVRYTYMQIEEMIILISGELQRMLVHLDFVYKTTMTVPGKLILKLIVMGLLN